MPLLTIMLLDKPLGIVLTLFSGFSNQFHSAHCWGQQKNAVVPQEVDVKFSWKWEKYWGVKGMLPLGCLPLWGREGVTLIASSK